jgi:hypothetical protein
MSESRQRKTPLVSEESSEKTVPVTREGLREMMKGIMLEISRPPEVQKLPGTHVPLARVPIKLGNSSHPSSVEVVAKYPDWAERNAALLRAIVVTLSGVSQRALGFALINPLERG